MVEEVNQICCPKQVNITKQLSENFDCKSIVASMGLLMLTRRTEEMCRPSMDAGLKFVQHTSLQWHTVCRLQPGTLISVYTKQMAQAASRPV